uniref:thioesterase family protein n=1 Tax=Eubacterium sp. TaxID=142586 RepID=UPI00402854CA
MKEITLGALASATTKVSSENTAVAAQSGSLEVFATPFMVALMEKATCLAVEPFLEGDETTVGISINISHDKASAVGEEITATAKITAVEGRKITFEVEAVNGFSEKIGGGTIARFAVSGEKFMSKLNTPKE